VSADEVEVFDYLNIIWKRRRLLLLGVSVALIFTIAVGLLTPKIYRCEGIIEMGVVNGKPVAAPTDAMVFFRMNPVIENFLKERGETASPDDFTLWGTGVGNTQYVRVYAESPRRRLLPDLIAYAADALGESLQPVYERSLGGIDLKIRNMEDSIDALEKRIAAMHRILVSEFSDSGAEKRDYYFYLNLLQDKEFQSLRLQGQLAELVSKRGDGISRVVSLSGDPKMHPGSVKPNWKRSLIIGGLIGILISVCLAFILEYVRMRRSLA